MDQREDLKTVIKAALLVAFTATFMRFDLPAGQAALTILIGRTLLCIVFGTHLLSSEMSLSEMRPSQLLPQTQLLLWGVGLLAIMLATDMLRWFEPTRNFWIGMALVLTFGSRAGFLWLWRRMTSESHTG